MVGLAALGPPYNYNWRSRRGLARRRGFTLIELLVTVTVMAILVATVLGGMRMANESARTARTRSTIAKINEVVMEQYESYHNRRVPKDLRAYAQSLAGSGTVKPEHYARAKLNALKDLMRMEMPDRWSDVTNGPLVLSSVPAVTLSYRRARQRALDNGVKSDTVLEWAASECFIRRLQSKARIHLTPSVDLIAMSMADPGEPFSIHSLPPSMARCVLSS